MQKTLIIIFAMTFLFRPALPVVEYLVNYDYIVSELCLNKDRQNMNCNGKCHLVSELADAADSSDDSQPDRKRQLHSELLFFMEAGTFPLTVAISVSNEITQPYSDLYHFQDSGSIFHPPAFV